MPEDCPVCGLCEFSVQAPYMLQLELASVVYLQRPIYFCVMLGWPSLWTSSQRCTSQTAPSLFSAQAVRCPPLPAHSTTHAWCSTNLATRCLSCPRYYCFGACISLSSVTPSTLALGADTFQYDYVHEPGLTPLAAPFRPGVSRGVFGVEFILRVLIDPRSIRPE